MSLSEWEDLLRPFYKKHTLILINKETNPELYLGFHKNKGTYVESGWARQQLLKLTIASIIEEEYYVSLDSKNIFIKPINIYETFYGEEGGTTVLNYYVVNPNLHLSLPYWSGWSAYIEHNYNIKRPKHVWFAGTPFVFKTVTVNKILKLPKLDYAFNLTARNEGFPSEYILYAYFTDASKYLNTFECSGSQIFYECDDVECVKSSLQDISIFIVYRKPNDTFEGLRKFLIDEVGMNLYYVNSILLNRQI
jgi:hypothetical protein